MAQFEDADCTPEQFATLIGDAVEHKLLTIVYLCSCQNKTGGTCKRKVTKGSVCRDHIGQTPTVKPRPQALAIKQPVSEELATEKRRCPAQKKDGTQCSLMCKADTDRCFMHAGTAQVAIPDIAPVTRTKATASVASDESRCVAQYTSGDKKGTQCTSKWNVDYGDRHVCGRHKTYGISK